MSNLILTSKAPAPNAAVMGRLADRWRDAGVYLASYDCAGQLQWHDPQFPRAMNLAIFHDRALSQQINLLPPGPEAVPHRLSSPIPGIHVFAVPLAKRRKLSAWLLVLTRDSVIAAGEDLCRLAQRGAMDVSAVIAQLHKIPALSAAQTGPIAALVRQMHDDVQLALTSQHELSNVTEQLTLVYEEISLLYKISSGMRFSQKSQPFLESVCREVQEIGNYGCVAAVLARPDDPGVLLDVAVMVGGCALLESELITALRQPILESLKAGETRVHNQPVPNADRPDLANAIQRFVCVPLMRDKRPMGVMLAIDKNDQREFDSVDLKLLNNVGNQCSIFLENATLYQDMQDLFMGVLHALTRSIDAKDAYTRGHSQRVAELSRDLARKIGIPDDQCERVYLSGLLHDVGKIGVPESILTKPGRLTDAEFEAIKKHPTIGGQILSNIKQLQDIIPGVLYHHERWDGNGYPHSLAAENIPLLGRIICVADSFDAMSSSRTYRPALPMETVLKEVIRCAGTQFDPALAKVFLTLDFASYSRALKEQTDLAAGALAREVAP